MSEEFVIPMAAIFMPVVLAPTVMAVRHMSKKREYEHLERMKALELGRSLPGGEAWNAAMAIAIGAAVPLGSLLVGWLGSMTTGTADGPWQAAASIGITSSICGSFLGWRLLGQRSSNKTSDPLHVVNGKPVHDPDAYDVAGRRG
jgi:hypothetical protein